MSKYATFVFDDGPNQYLCSMVDKFKSFGFTAAFAIIGRQINDNTEPMLKYAIDNGFELLSHGQRHKGLGQTQDRQEILDEIMPPIEEVEKRLGYKISIIRTAFLSYNDQIHEITKELKYPLMGCGFGGGRDWADETTPESIANSVLSSIEDGDVGCLHVTKNTLAALDTILPELKNRGYILTTPTELFKIKGIENIPIGLPVDNFNDFI